MKDTGSALLKVVTETPIARTATATAVAIGTLAAPAATAAATAVLNGGTPASALRYLLFFWKPRKRKHWGKVYDAENHLPLVGVQVGLIPVGQMDSIRLTVTDPSGGFNFLISNPGEYKMGITAAGYASYMGENEKVTSAPQAQKSIYLSRDNKGFHETHTTSALLLSALSKWLGIVSPICFLLGVSFSIYNLVRFEDRLSIAILAIYILIGIQQVILITKISFGGTVLTNKGEPIRGTLIRAFLITDQEKTALASCLTNKKGNYRFQLKPGTYAFTVAKEGYNTFTSQQITLTKKTSGESTITLEPFSYLGNTYGE